MQDLSEYVYISYILQKKSKSADLANTGPGAQYFVHLKKIAQAQIWKTTYLI